MCWLSQRRCYSKSNKKTHYSLNFKLTGGPRLLNTQNAIKAYFRLASNINDIQSPTSKPLLYSSQKLNKNAQSDAFTLNLFPEKQGYKRVFFAFSTGNLRAHNETALQWRNLQDFHTKTFIRRVITMLDMRQHFATRIFSTKRLEKRQHNLKLSLYMAVNFSVMIWNGNFERVFSLVGSQQGKEMMQANRI